MNGNKIISLDHLLNKYYVTIWDTCALSTHLNGSKTSTRDYFFIKKLTAKIKEGHICILPQAIIEEIENYKSTNPFKIKAKNKLMKAYNKFSQRGKSYFNEQDVKKEVNREFSKYAWSGVSHADLAIFEGAKILSRTGTPTAIISNDITGLSRVWNSYTKGAGIPNSVLGFLPRVGKSLFEVFKNGAKRNKCHALANDYVAVLDDREKWRKVTANNLNHYGCNNITYFKTKNNIIKAHQLNNIQTPDVAFLDINLNPNNSRNREGLEVCQFFRENIPDTTIVAMSSLENIAEEAKKNGANFIIQKKNFVQDFDTFIQQYTEKS